MPTAPLERLAREDFNLVQGLLWLQAKINLQTYAFFFLESCFDVLIITRALRVFSKRWWTIVSAIRYAIPVYIGNVAGWEDIEYFTQLKEQNMSLT